MSVLVTNLARILSDLYCIRSSSEPPSAHVPGAYSEFLQFQSPHPSTNDAVAIESNNFNSDSYTIFISKRGLKMASLNITSLPKHIDELRDRDQGNET